MIGQEKLAQLWQRLEGLNLGGMLIMNSDNLTLRSPNPYYLTGLKATLQLVVAAAEKLYLITDSRYELTAKQIFPPENVRIITSFDTLISEIASLFPSAPTRVGFESSVWSYQTFNRFKDALPGIVLVPIPAAENPIVSLRRNKDQHEIDLLRRAQEITATALLETLGQLKSGMSEIEFAAKIESAMKRHGATGIWPSEYGFIVASGFESAKPHYSAAEKVFQDGDIVQFDVGAEYRGYYGDFSRVVFLGEPDPELSRAFGIVSDALRFGIELCRPGANCRQVDKAVRERMGPYAEFFGHGLGHGVGLQIHEIPNLSGISAPEDMVLEIGDVVTVEPGVYLEGKGGVRLEEMVVIRDDGPEVLGQGIFPPDKLICL